MSHPTPPVLRPLSVLLILAICAAPAAEGGDGDGGGNGEGGAAVVRQTVAVSSPENPRAVGFVENEQGLDWRRADASKMLHLTIDGGERLIKDSRQVAQMPWMAGVPVMWRPPPDNPQCTRTKLWRSTAFPAHTQFLAFYRGEFCAERSDGGGGGGEGEGGGGEPDEWVAGVLMADLDADADNDSQRFRRPPTLQGGEGDQEDVAEQAPPRPDGPTDAREPGLLICVNRGFEEGGVEEPVEDLDRPGIAPVDRDAAEARGAQTADPDLVAAVATLKVPNPATVTAEATLTYGPGAADGDGEDDGAGGNGGAGDGDGDGEADGDEEDPPPRILVYAVDEAGDHALIESGVTYPFDPQGPRFEPADAENPLGTFQAWGPRTDLLIEGLAPSPAAGEDAMILTLTPANGSESRDRVHFTVIDVDLDVDSDNDDGFDAPGRTTVEDVIEDLTEKGGESSGSEGKEDCPGKVLCVNDDDNDGDGIPDFADGFDFDKQAVDDDQTAGERFVPVVLELPEAIDVDEARLRISYAASDPAKLTRTGSGNMEDPFVYEAAPGNLRLWTEPGDEKRDARAVGVGGDFVPGDGEAAVIDDLGTLGFAADQREATLYLEGIRPSDEVGDQRIVVELDPNDEESSPAFLCTDAVRMTVVQVDLLALHRDGRPRAAKNFKEIGDEASCFVFFDRRDVAEGVIWARGRLVPALSRGLAQELFGSGQLRLEVSPIDGSHEDADDDREIGEWTELTWRDPLGEGEAEDHRIGELDFARTDRLETYDPSSGEWETFALFLGMPLHNSDFGEKELRLVKGSGDGSEDGDGMLVDSLPFAVFHTRFRSTHPVPRGTARRANVRRSANWYFYWSQQQAGEKPAVCQYEYGGSNPTVNHLRRGGDEAPFGIYHFHRTKSERRIVRLTNRIAETIDGLDATGVFNDGDPMTWESEDGEGNTVTVTIRAAWSCDTAPELANIVFAHEMTHHASQVEAIKRNVEDRDGDGVPNQWEEDVGMNPRAADTLEGQFTGSQDTRGGGSDRDQELYAWINACFQPTYNGVYEVTPAPDDGVTYRGEIPEPADNAQDWSEGGENWQERCDEEGDDE